MISCWAAWRIVCSSLRGVFRRPVFAFFLVVSLCACATTDASRAGSQPEQLAFRGDSSHVRAVIEAARSVGVPRDVLLTLAWAESRLAHHIADLEHGTARCGFFGFDDGIVRSHAASLAGADATALCEDEALEARAAALTLRELATAKGLTLGSDESAWLALLDAWHPSLAERGFPYADYLVRMRREGFRGSDERGESIYMPPAPTLGSVIAEPASRVGVSRALSRPDTPVARWEGPACDYARASREIGDVEFVVIHTCEGGFAGCVETLSNCGGTSVSAHYVTSYTGMSVQLVEENDVAWHVGCLNSSSVGIENEGFSASATHPDAQYCTSARLVRSICDRWDIPCDRDHVIGHVEANSLYCHGSHTDPGPNWDWDTFMGYVARGGCDACTPTAETCDGMDNDCDGMIDEGVANACGGCGMVTREMCDGVDNDCDGAIDEGVLNACGTCGRAPVEICDGLDNDCDGVVDDHTCGAEPEDAGPDEDAGVAYDASMPFRVDSGVSRDGGVSADGAMDLVPMRPGCSVSGATGGRSPSVWTMLGLLSLLAALAIRRRA